MQLTHLFTASSCGGSHCPAVYATDTTDLVVQGYTLDAGDSAQMNLAHNEAGVRIPAALAEQIADMVIAQRSAT